MKKILILLAFLIILTGCTKISQSSYSEIISSVVTSKYDINNEYRTGYKYYIPSGMSSINSNDYNEVIASSSHNYYLYVDVVSYYNRVISEYDVNHDAYYSNPINYEDKFGYLEVNKQSNGKYLVEIMYNYAKIEVMVEECDLKSAITNSIIILSSINYNNDILGSIIGDNVLEFNEETFDIFKTKKKETNFLDVETRDVDFKEEVVDPDLVD
ncbi:MAG: hypothetical protein IJ572_04345 [Bacilli bacterium]|nr:hypothetical protein [Bacilli bacterium]